MPGESLQQLLACSSVSTYRGLCPGGSDSKNWTVNPVSSRHGKCVASSGSKNWTVNPVITHCGKFPVGSEGKNWTVNPVSIHCGRMTMRSVSNTRNRTLVSDHSMQSCSVGNHRCTSTVSHIGRRHVKDCLCSIPGSTNLGSVSL